MHRGFWRETPIKIYHVEDLSVDGRIILKRVFKKLDGDNRTYCCGSELGQVAGACECGNEPSGSINCRLFLDKLRNCHLLRKDSIPWS